MMNKSGVLFRLGRQVGAQMVRKVHEGYISTPPLNYVHPLEKAAHGCAIAVAVFSYPMWVMSHLDDYRPAPPFKGIQHLIDAGDFEQKE